MPSYTFHCEEGHVTILKISYTTYDLQIKGDGDTAIICKSCWVEDKPNRIAKIKIYPPEFNITPGIWDDLGTGSYAEDQLRREGYF